jgi:hypothetical protein
MERPELEKLPLEEVSQKIREQGVLIVTMSRKQWDNVLEESYKSGAVLLEVNSKEEIIAAYQIPTYCRGCSFKCQATECDCVCHDRMREYWAKQKGGKNG